MKFGEIQCNPLKLRTVWGLGTGMGGPVHIALYGTECVPIVTRGATSGESVVDAGVVVYTVG